MEPFPADSGLLTPPEQAPPPHQKFRDRVWLHTLLFVLTALTTTLVGAAWYAGFRSDFGTHPVQLSFWSFALHGLWYSGPLIAILGCHELGHYLACRYYDVDASLPYFIPMPIVLTGTMGAVIRIREPIRRKDELFDIGIAGPIAGFLVAVPALFFGVAMSNIARIPPNTPGIEFGEPPLFKLAQAIFWGTPPDGYGLNMHPMVFAAWVGMLVTTMNLFPIGQLDGGHISYAVFGRRSRYVTMGALAFAIGLILLSPSPGVWVTWTALSLAMLFLFGINHPRVHDEEVPLDRTRLLLALFAVVMFILCFTPAPARLVDLIK